MIDVINVIKPKILLVNDHAPTLLALEALLTNAVDANSYEVVTAKSGDEALRHVLAHRFSVILLDVSMPGMDGFETAELIHSRPRSAATPIIFITAHYADELNRLKGYELGAVDYLITPVIPKVLLSKVAVFVELAKTNLQLESKTEELAELNQDLQVQRVRELKQNNEALAAEIVERRQAEERAHELATKDPLTGLLNRRSLIASLDHAIERAHRNNEPIALLFLDMDRFKSINDTLGHDVGDELLRDVAARIMASVRKSDLVARLGGDEFVVLMQGMSTYRDVAKVAEQIVQAATPPFKVGHHQIKTSVTIGIGLFPQDGNSTQSLMRSADLAMYHAKQERRGSVQFFSSGTECAPARTRAPRARTAACVRR
ncbi:diguanylate cyclase domain-containing protein [Undibacterium arcticum]